MSADKVSDPRKAWLLPRPLRDGPRHPSIRPADRRNVEHRHMERGEIRSKLSFQSGAGVSVFDVEEHGVAANRSLDENPWCSPRRIEMGAEVEIDRGQLRTQRGKSLKERTVGIARVVRHHVAASRVIEAVTFTARTTRPESRRNPRRRL